MYVTESTDEAISHMIDGYAQDFLEVINAIGVFSDIDREELKKARVCANMSIEHMKRAAGLEEK